MSNERQPETIREGTPPRLHVLDAIRDGQVPSWLRTAAAVGWRLLVVCAVVFVAAAVVSRFQVIVVPLIVALLIAAFLAPPVRWMERRGVHSLVATWIVILAGAALVAGLGWLIVPRLAAGFNDFGTALTEAYQDSRAWLIEGPLALDPADVQDTEDRIAHRFRQLAETGLTTRATLIVDVITAIFLTLVITFFYVKDGPAFRDKILGLVPEEDRRRARAALHEGWWVTQRYLLAVVVVGAVDAVIIGAGLAVIGVPHVLSLMALTFLAAFFPLVGAIFAGGVAAMLALGAGGVSDALLVIGLTVIVQQVDGDVVAPLVYSRAVDLHPLAVLLALTAGAVIGGIIGAFLAVPALAVTLAVARTWRAPAGELDQPASVRAAEPSAAAAG